MSPAVVAFVAVLALLTAIGVHDLQHRLEKWAYDRPVED